SDDLASGPPNGSGLARYQCGFDGGLSVRRGAICDQPWRNAYVGMVAGNDQKNTSAARGRNGDRERGAASFDAKWEPGIKSHGKVGTAGQDSGGHAIFELQGKDLAVLPSVENGHACGESDLSGVLSVSLALKLDRSEDGFTGDAELQICMLDCVVQGEAV